MSKTTRIVVVIAVVAAVMLAVVVNQYRKSASVTNNESAVTRVTAKLPRLVDFGAGKCVPCKLMSPILEGLKKEYAGRMNVEFVDVWVNPDDGKPYNIEMIPTQIFFDADGKELFRHEGFFGREDILGKWKELGVDFGGKPSVSAPDAMATNNQVIAYYFHGTVRCETCLKIEQQARAVIERQFKPESDAQRLVFIPLNYDLPENAHFLLDYKLACPSLVLVHHNAGKDEQRTLLGDTWELVEDPVKFDDYIKTEVNKFLSGPQKHEAGNANIPPP
jgi:thioredoxin 1